MPHDVDRGHPAYAWRSLCSIRGGVAVPRREWWTSARRFYAPCRHADDSVDLGAFLERILLFERYIIDSARLMEIPGLVRAFGVDAFASALNSGVIQVHHALVCLVDRNTNVPMHYRLYHVTEPAQANWEHKLKLMFAELRDLTLYERDKLKNALRRASVPTPPGLPQEALRCWKEDLEKGTDLVSRAVGVHLREQSCSEVPRFSLRLHLLDATEGLVYAETICRCLTMSSTGRIWAGMGAVANIDLRLEQMRRFQAVCGFRDVEQPLVDAKLSFLLNVIHDGTQERQLRRVLHLSDLPDLGEAASRGEIDLEKLLVVRSSRECAEFREWLRSLDLVDEVDLRERIASLRARLGRKLATVGGRAFRFLASLGDPTGGIASGTTGFLVDKVLARSGPIVFLHDQLPDIFKA